MADVSDPKIQEGLFPNNVEQIPVFVTIPNQTLFFIAYLDVRSDKSEVNWLLLDYEACFSFFSSFPRCDVLTWLCGDPRTIAPTN